MAIELVAVGNSLESITLGKGNPPANPKYILFSLTLVLAILCP